MTDKIINATAFIAAAIGGLIVVVVFAYIITGLVESLALGL